MAFTVQHLIDGRSKPVTVLLTDPVQKALELMFEYDFSQLPITDSEGRVVEGKEKKAKMVTSDSVLHALSNFRLMPNTETLLVSDAMIQTSTFGTEEDPFELFKELRDNQAVFVEQGEDRVIVGIVTSFDATAFFRRRAEDIILVEEIENAIKDYIMLYFRGSIGEAGQAQLQDAIEAIMPSHNKLQEPFRQALTHYLTIVGSDQLLNEEAEQEAFTRYIYKDKAPSFDDLTLGQYIDLLMYKSRWESYRKAFKLDRDAILRLFDDVRKIRNKLMHFRDEISINDRKLLRYCKEWLERHRSHVEAIFPLKKVEPSAQQSIDIVEVPLPISLQATTVSEFVSQMTSSDVENIDSISEDIQPWDEISLPDNSRYAPLALYLLKKPTNVEGELLAFTAIEEIIDGKLPASARQSRSWWANDSVGHVQSRQWLDVGWRVSYVDMEKGTVLFTRIHDRQKLYIDFFNALLVDLNQKAQFHLRKPSPNGQSWVVIAGIPEGGPLVAFLAFSFARYERFRLELYIDRGDKERNKLIFDSLHRFRDEIEDTLSKTLQEVLQWERIDDKRASRIALYHRGTITDNDEELADLRIWAVNAMIQFQQVMEQYISRVMSEIL